MWHLVQGDHDDRDTQPCEKILLLSCFRQRYRPISRPAAQRGYGCVRNSAVLEQTDVRILLKRLKRATEHSTIIVRGRRNTDGNVGHGNLM